MTFGSEEEQIKFTNFRSSEFSNNMKIVQTIIGFLAVAVIAVGIIMANKHFARYLDLKAIHECSQDYQQEYEQDEKIKVVRPLEQQVRECAWNKGVRGWDGIWTGLPK